MRSLQVAFGRFRSLSVVLLLLTVATLGAFGSGSASDRIRGAESEAEIHCNATLAPIRGNQKSSDITDIICFDTLAEATRHATNGEVRPKATDTWADIRQEMFASQAARQIISISFARAEFRGNTYRWQSDNPRGCNDGTSYSVATVPPAWNDAISSSESNQAAGCDINFHFANANFGGIQIRCQCNRMGEMNNKTSSISWRAP